MGIKGRFCTWIREFKKITIAELAKCGRGRIISNEMQTQNHGSIRQMGRYLLSIQQFTLHFDYKFGSLVAEVAHPSLATDKSCGVVFCLSSLSCPWGTCASPPSCVCVCACPDMAQWSRQWRHVTSRLGWLVAVSLCLSVPIHNDACCSLPSFHIRSRGENHNSRKKD